MRTLAKYAIVLGALSACAAPQNLSTATSKAICEAWSDVTFLPSVNDTQETAELVNLAYDTQEKVCVGIG